MTDNPPIPIQSPSNAPFSTIGGADRELPRTLLALGVARARLGVLRDCVPDPLAFRDEFVVCLGLLQRVGAVLDDEAKGRRTPEFTDFWRKTREDEFLRYLTRVRNDEFKAGKTRVGFKQHTTMHPGHSFRVRAVRRGRDELYIVHDSPLPPGVVHEMTWVFVGGRFDGGDVLELCARHVEWLTEIVRQAATLVVAHPWGPRAT